MTDLAINVADLRDRITLQSPTISKDAGGAQVESYANVGSDPTVWAQWVNDHGLELVSSEAERSIQRATVTIRDRSDVLTTWRVLRDGVAWGITSVDRVRGQNRWVVLRVERTQGTV